jgi:hypothetical protein
MRSSSGTRLRDALPSHRPLLSEAQSIIRADNIMYTVHSSRSRKDPSIHVLSLYLQQGSSGASRYVGLLWLNPITPEKKKPLNHGGLRQGQRTTRLERPSFVASSESSESLNVHSISSARLRYQQRQPASSRWAPLRTVIRLSDFSEHHSNWHASISDFITPKIDLCQ